LAAFKIDIAKAFDTISWDFILKIMEVRNFSFSMDIIDTESNINWIYSDNTKWASREKNNFEERCSSRGSNIIVFVHSCYGFFLQMDQLASSIRSLVTAMEWH
jgi:hypothetical protein